MQIIIKKKFFRIYIHISYSPYQNSQRILLLFYQSIICLSTLIKLFLIKSQVTTRKLNGSNQTAPHPTLSCTQIKNIKLQSNIRYFIKATDICLPSYNYLQLFLLEALLFSEHCLGGKKTFLFLC